MGNRGDGIDLLWQRFLGLRLSWRILHQSVRPAFGQDGVHATLDDGIDDTARHGFGVRHDNAPKANVDDLLVGFARFTDEVQKILRRLPFL